MVKQVHGTAVIEAARAAPETEADGAVTRGPGAVCAVMTADCLPVLLSDRAGKRAGSPRRLAWTRGRSPRKRRACNGPSPARSHRLHRTGHRSASLRSRRGRPQGFRRQRSRRCGVVRAASERDVLRRFVRACAAAARGGGVAKSMAGNSAPRAKSVSSPSAGTGPPAEWRALSGSRTARTCRRLHGSPRRPSRAV